MKFVIKKILSESLEENCYIIHKTNRHALIIDPGSSSGKIINYLEENQLKVLGIFNTHAHFDHIESIEELKNKYSIPFYLHSKDLKLLRYSNIYYRFINAKASISIPTVDKLLDKEQLPIATGSFIINMLYTPGHTEGGVCFLIDENIFCGDIILKGKIGRAVPPWGNKDKLNESIKTIMKLPGRFKIYPGHGEPTTISKELIRNYELKGIISEN